MKYLIVQDWFNTTNNHAGMKYLCCELATRYPHEYITYIIPDYYKKLPQNFLLKKIHIFKAKYNFKQRLKNIFLKISKEVQSGDQIFLMEYLEILCPQLYLAQKFKNLNLNITIYAMVHLIPYKLEKNFTDKEFRNWIVPIDKFITLGTSLSKYLIKKGVKREDIITSFHYVDNKYYRPSSHKKTNSRIQVIAMGNQERNVKLLQQVVKHNPTTKFIICQGVNDLSLYFRKMDNVQLIPFVEESKLRKLMDESDISINIMNDTIGSNVIVTSMAMGLAMICSDVGSIRDYCDIDNSILCNDADDFLNAIKKLNINRNLLISMKLNSLRKSQDLSIERFHEFIKNK